MGLKYTYRETQTTKYTDENFLTFQGKRWFWEDGGVGGKKLVVSDNGWNDLKVDLVGAVDVDIGVEDIVVSTVAGNLVDVGIDFVEGNVGRGDCEGDVEMSENAVVAEGDVGHGGVVVAECVGFLLPDFEMHGQAEGGEDSLNENEN